MSNLQFKIITQRDEAKEVWDRFSPHKTIDDEWDFRDIWTRELNFPFHFIVGYNNDTPIGLLPLQLNTLKGLGPTLLHRDEPFLEFFGGIDIDDNKVLLLPGYEQLSSKFIEQIKNSAVLTSLADKLSFNNYEAEYYLNRFELDITKFSDFKTFLQTNLDGVSRQRLINRLNKLHKEFRIEIKDGNAADLETMFKFSMDRFGERSSFHLPQRQQVYRDILKHFPVDLFTIFLNGKIKAVAFCIMFKGSYISLNIGYDYSIRDISKLLVVTQIERAMTKLCTRFDAGQGDNGWKEHFNLTKIPQYILTLEIENTS